MFVERSGIRQEIETALGRSRVVTLLGPRQSGKTTLARQFVSPDSLNYFDLEDPISLARLDQPMLALRDLQGIVVIDEIQRRPDLFPILRVLVDRTPLPARFLVLGSAAPELLRQSSESLAGRMEMIALSGFSLPEVGAAALPLHWLRGGFPLSYLAPTEANSLAWRKNFIQTILERDLPQLGIGLPTAMVFRFWSMLAHYHGQTWNAAEPARSLGVSETSVRRYLDLLEQVFMIRQLPPWHVNMQKRQVKSPKIYFRDTGLLHYLLGIHSVPDLMTHPKLGASWEGYALEEIIKAFKPDAAFFWATHGGAELDLLLQTGGQKVGIECKRVDAPRLTRSMQVALTDLELDHLFVVYPGEQTYPLAEKITAIPLLKMVFPKTV
ncbi:MAG: ATP-binding protein [Candidatus Promineifilaceae bacterium]